MQAPTTVAVTPTGRLARSRWRSGLLAWALWALAMLGLVATAWLDHLSRQAARPDLAQLASRPVIAPVLAMLSATTVGAVLAGRRPRHPVGWLLLVLGISPAAGGVGASCAAHGLLARPGALPGAIDVARYSPVTNVAALLALSLVLLLTPTGSLPSSRWRWWARVAVAAPVALLVAVAVAGGPIDPQYQALNSPFDFRGLGGVLLVITR